MNQYIEEVNETRQQLTREGRVLATRLARLQKASEEIDSTIQGVGIFIGIILCGVWFWLGYTQNQLLTSTYETARIHLPQWLGLLLLNDLMPMLWLLVIGVIIAAIPGTIFKMRILVKIDRIRSRIFALHPELPEAIRLCEIRPSQH